jgi:hypothetical protein
MSAEPSSSSGLPGRHRPHLSELNRETTEDDLWNLDEEDPAAQTNPKKPTPRELPQKPVATESELPGTAKDERAPAVETAAAKPLQNQPRPSRPDEIGDLDEDEAVKEPVALTTSIDEDPPAAAPPVRKKESAAETETRVEAPEKTAPQATEPEHPAPATPKENRPRQAAPAAKGSLPRPRLNRREVIGIASFAVVVMIAAVWVLTRFFSQLSFSDDSAGLPDFPLKGEVARVASAETFWREPIRDGSNRDVAKREVVVIPVLEVTLDPDSGGGALRVIFRNDQGEPVGDPITRSFGAGRFEASGSATIAFPATDGFLKDGSFQAYRTGKGKLWTADVLEGPSASSAASSFKKLSSIPILPLRR